MNARAVITRSGAFRRFQHLFVCFITLIYHVSRQFGRYFDCKFSAKSNANMIIHYSQTRSFAWVYKLHGWDSVHLSHHATKAARASAGLERRQDDLPHCPNQLSIAAMHNKLARFGWSPSREERGEDVRDEGHP